MSSSDNPLAPLLELNRLVHEPARLMIMGMLSVVEEADFLFLMRNTGLTKGNLSSHISKLEKAFYLLVRKEFVGRLPRTVLKLTPEGRAALASYKDKMSRVLGAL